MRIISFLLAIAMVAVLSACEGSAEKDATSELLIYNNATGALISSGSERGSITLNETGGTSTRQLRVMRRVTDEDEGTTTTNVTTDADFNTSDPDVVTVGDNGSNFAGLVTATGPGTAIIEVSYSDPEDPTSDDSASIDVNVVP
jgi:hypothetical protein